MTVVAVLMTSCQVSLKPKTGPTTAHASIVATAITNVTGLPAAREVAEAKRANLDLDANAAMRLTPMSLKEFSGDGDWRTGRGFSSARTGPSQMSCRMVRRRRCMPATR
jgi:hypothetical protein